MLRHHFTTEGKKIYTLDQTKSDSHPAKFSPVDQFSDERVLFKKRYDIWPFNE